MVSPVYLIILIIVGVLLLVGVAALAAVGGVIAWQAWALVKVNRLCGETLAAVLAPAKDMVGKIDALSVVVTELKAFQEGDLKLIDKQIKATISLDRTVEELQACLIAPPETAPRARPRSRGEVVVATESDELVREQQRKERQGGLSAEDLEKFGQNVATV